MKRIVSTIVFVVLALSSAHAQLIEGLLYGLGGSWLSRQIFPAKKEEFGSGKIVFNVYDVRDGNRKFVNCWDPSTGTAQAWNNGTLLVPVLGVNESGTLGEVQWALSTENGPLVKQQHNEVKGGHPDKDGSYKDNTGYKYEPYSLRMADLPWGAVFVTASWGKGKSTTVQLMHIDVGHVYQLFDNDEGLRREFAGSGGGTFPQMPITTVIVDGKAYYFNSPQEAEDYFTKGTYSPSPTQPFVDHNSQPTQKPKEPSTPDKPAEPWKGEWRFGYYRYELTDDLCGQVSTKTARSFDQWSANLPRGKKLAVLLVSDQKFGVARVDKDGALLGTVSATEKNGHYEVFVGVVLDDDQPKGALVVSDAAHHTSVLEIVRTEEK